MALPNIPIFNPSTPDYTDPRFRTAAEMAALLGIDADAGSIRQKYLDAARDAYRANLSNWQTSQASFNQNIGQQQGQTLRQLLDLYAAQASGSTGAQSGANAANILSYLLGGTQETAEGALELANTGVDLGREYASARSDAERNALTDYNNLMTMLGQLSAEIQANEVQAWAAELAAYQPEGGSYSGSYGGGDYYGGDAAPMSDDDLLALLGAGGSGSGATGSPTATMTPDSTNPWATWQNRTGQQRAIFPPTTPAQPAAPRANTAWRDLLNSTVQRAEQGQGIPPAYSGSYLDRGPTFYPGARQEAINQAGQPGSLADMIAQAAAQLGKTAASQVSKDTAKDSSATGVLPKRTLRAPASAQRSQQTPMYRAEQSSAGANAAQKRLQEQARKAAEARAARERAAQLAREKQAQLRAQMEKARQAAAVEAQRAADAARAAAQQRIQQMTQARRAPQKQVQNSQQARQRAQDNAAAAKKAAQKKAIQKRKTGTQ